MSEFIKIYPEKKTVAVDIFNGSKVDEGMNKEEIAAIGRFYSGTIIADALELHRKNQKLDMNSLHLKGEAMRKMKKLIDTEVVDASGSVHPENLTKFFKGTAAGKVRDLRVENPGKKTKEIAKELNYSSVYTRVLVRELKQAGLLEVKKETEKNNNFSKKSRIGCLEKKNENNLYDERIFSLIKENQGMNSSMIGFYIKKSSNYVSTEIKKLLDQKKIVFIQPFNRKSTFYFSSDFIIEGELRRKTVVRMVDKIKETTKEFEEKRQMLQSKI